MAAESNIMMHDQPSLAMEECSEEGDPHAALVDQVRTSGGTNREALAYLLRYETMVRQQEAEDMATLSHIRPCVERLQELAGTSTENDNSNVWSDMDTEVLTQEISFAELKTALDKLEEQDSAEFMTTDRQLMMVLRMLTQKTTEMDADVRITWAEFLQCYKVCICGMQTLQHVPMESRVRARTRDRTLSMLSLFEPPSTKLFTDEGHSIDSGALTTERRRSKMVAISRAPTNKRSKKKRRMLAMALLSMVIAAVAFYIIQSAGNPPPAVEEEVAPEQVTPLEAFTSMVTHHEHLVAPSAQPVATFMHKPVVQQLTKPIEVRSLPSTHQETNTFFSNSTPDHLPPSMESVTSPALVGGIMGILGAPLLVAGVQVLVAGLAAGNLVPTAVFAVGIASIAQRMLKFCQKLLAKKQ